MLWNLQHWPEIMFSLTDTHAPRPPQKKKKPKNQKQTNPRKNKKVLLGLM